MWPFKKKKEYIVIVDMNEIKWGKEEEHRRVVFDIDDTILMGGSPKNNYDCSPNKQMIQLINTLHKEGWCIVLMTGRNAKRRPQTVRQLNHAGIKYQVLIMGKPPAIAYVDDKAVKYTDMSPIREIEMQLRMRSAAQFKRCGC